VGAEGWEWVVISCGEESIPELAWLQVGRNSANFTGKPQAVFELASTFSDLVHSGLGLATSHEESQGR